MRGIALASLLSLTLAGCLSFSSFTTPKETVYVPTTTVITPVVCPSGFRLPC